MRRLRPYSFFLALCLALFSAPSYAEMRGLPSITVLAASSMTDVITELARTYSRQKNITVSTAYDSSSLLALQIIEGESADIYISAHPIWMTELKQRGLIDVFSLTNLIKNTLVITASNKNRLDTLLLKGKAVPEILEKVIERTIPVIADPTDVPLGMYTKEALESLGFWQKMEKNVIRTASARNTLYLISKGQSVGITYHTDAVNNPEVTILSALSPDTHAPIIYQAAVVAGENMTEARKFLEFLKSNNARKVFEKHHFFVD